MAEPTQNSTRLAACWGARAGVGAAPGTSATFPAVDTAPSRSGGLPAAAGGGFWPGFSLASSFAERVQLSGRQGDQELPGSRGGPVGSAATCSGRGKKLGLAALPPSSRSCLGGEETPEMLPQVQDSGPYRPTRGEQAIPATGDRGGPRCASPWRDSTGRRRAWAPRDPRSWPCPSLRRELGCGRLQTPPPERLQRQPPPPPLGAGGGGGSHPGVTAPRPLPPRQGRSIKARWRPALRIPPVTLVPIPRRGAYSRAPAAAQGRQPASHGECRDHGGPTNLPRGGSPEPAPPASFPALFWRLNSTGRTLVLLSTCSSPGPFLVGRPTTVSVMF